MAKVRSNDWFFDGMVLHAPDTECDLDPELHAPCGAYSYLDPEAHRIAEEAHAKRRSEALLGSVRADLEAQINAAADEKLRAAAEAKVKGATPEAEEV